MSALRGTGLVVMLVLLSASTHADTQPATAPEISVAVGIPPVAFFVKNIGGGLVDVQVMLAPGHSPATYDPTPREMSRLASAKVYFEVGVPFEKQLSRTVQSAFPDLHLVDLRTELNIVHTDTTRDGHEHDPHYWLDPRLMVGVAGMICDELIKLSPTDSGLFRSNLNKLTDQLRQTDSLIAAKLAPYKGREIWVFHPAYDYFTEAYDLKQVAIEHEGKEPAGKQLADLVDRARANKVKVIFVQPQFSANTAETIAHEIGARIEPLDPLASDYLENLKEMAARIAAALAGTE